MPTSTIFEDKHCDELEIEFREKVAFFTSKLTESEECVVLVFSIDEVVAIRDYLTMKLKQGGHEV